MTRCAVWLMYVGARVSVRSTVRSRAPPHGSAQQEQGGAIGIHALEEHGDWIELTGSQGTAGGIVVGQLTQQIEKPNPATYLGKGKIEELTQRLSDTEATLIVFDDEQRGREGDAGPVEESERGR